MLAVAEIAEPGLESGRVVLSNLLAVGLERGLAGDGCPLARRVEECKVDVVVRLEIIGLARLRVRVEDEVDTVTLLWYD